ncbi:hypothetical protein [Kocuria sp. KH4]
MEPKIAVVVQVDLDGRQVRIVVTGAVTEINQRGLRPLIGRARRLVPGIRVVVDLSAAESVEPAAMDLLRWSAEHENSGVGSPKVEFLLTDPGTAPADSNPETTTPAGLPMVQAAPGAEVTA